MERYDEYKDSGVEWIGEIPAGWEVARIGQVASLSRQFDSHDDRYVGLENIESWTGRYVESDSSCDTSQAVAFARGDVLFGKLRPYLAKVFEASFSGLCSSELLPLTPRRVDGAYLSFCLRSPRFIEVVNESTYGTKMPRANWQYIRKLQIPLPPRNVQAAIASFLRSRTYEIDGVIADCEREVELLQEYRKAVISEAVTRGLAPNVPMKDSGIEWIGEIPETWIIGKLAFYGSLQNGISKGGEYFGSGYPFVSYGNVYRSEINKLEKLGLIESSKDERNRYSVKRGDVLFTRTSETIDEVGIASTCLHDIDDGCFAGFVVRFRPGKEWGMSPEFSAYYFRSDIYRPYLTKEMVLVTRASLGQRLLGGITVLFPPLSEQHAIVAYLDEKTAEIDALIADYQSMAKKLREYRKSLISEAVTGKFKVPGLA